MNKSALLLFFAISIVFTNSCFGQAIWYAEHLTCGYRVNPLGIDEVRPHFSWKYRSAAFNQYQSAYHILVASSADKLKLNIGDIWDSKAQKVSNNIDIPYGGGALSPGTRYFWKVRGTNRRGQQTPWSKTALFETGLGASSNWHGGWISNGRAAPTRDRDFYEDRPAPIFRKEFTLSGKVVEARLYISGLGYYEAYLNGGKIGDQVLDPGWTNYSKTVLYSVFDITRQIRPGRNALGVLLGNGWYNLLPLKLFGAFELRKVFASGEPKVIANLRIRYADGSMEIISTDSSWKTASSYIMRNDIYLGETQDGRRFLPGWDRPGYSDGKWAAATHETPPGGTLQAQSAPPIRITKILPVRSVTEPFKGVYVFDLGQNFAGWIRMEIRGRGGQRIHFRYGELLNSDGRVNGMTTVAGHIKEIWGVKGGPGSPATAYQEDNYVCNGGGTEVFQPHFTFHAFRYVEVTGLSGAPDKKSLLGLLLHADITEAGSFNCSDTLLNRIQTLCQNSFLSNVFSVQSDCPGRERQGYGADMVVSAEAFSFNYDMSCFYAKTVNDFANDARANGGMPECAPYNGISSEGFDLGAGPVGWQLAFPFLQEHQYRFYGNKTILAEQYERTKALVNFLRSQSHDHLIDHDIGDHVAINARHVSLTSGAFYFHHVKLLREFSCILGKTADYEQYSSLLDSIRQSFNHRYFRSGSGQYDTMQNQTTQVFALWYDLVPALEKEKALEVLADDIMISCRGHLSTGIFGTKMLFDVLRRGNRNDIGLIITRQRAYPGYGFMISNGATTLWETWEKPDQNSWNHPMFGSVSEWFYRSLAGINPADDACGMDKLVIAPYTGRGLRFVRGRYASIRGDIVSNWHKDKDILDWTVTIPPNVTGEIVVPAPDLTHIREHGKVVGKNNNLHFEKQENGRVTLRAVSGQYHFRVR